MAHKQTNNKKRTPQNVENKYNRNRVSQSNSGVAQGARTERLLHHTKHLDFYPVRKGDIMGCFVLADGLFAIVWLNQGIGTALGEKRTIALLQ
jgi:hypothetical protein